MTAPDLKAELQAIADALAQVCAAMPAERCLDLANTIDSVSVAPLAALLNVPAGEVQAGMTRVSAVFRLLEKNQRDGTIAKVQDRLVRLQGHAAELWALANLFL